MWALMAALAVAVAVAVRTPVARVWGRMVSMAAPRAAPTVGRPVAAGLVLSEQTRRHQATAATAGQVRPRPSQARHRQAHTSQVHTPTAVAVAVAHMGQGPAELHRPAVVLAERLQTGPQEQRILVAVAVVARRVTQLKTRAHSVVPV
jgi:hypothetical protein